MNDRPQQASRESLNRSQVIARRGDLSPFLVHLTRDGFLTTEPRRKVYLDAAESLQRIIQEQQITAKSPFGYFKYRLQTELPGSQIVRDWLKATCFTETPVDHIYLQCLDIVGRSWDFRPYGLAFFEKAIRSKNGHPLFYFNSQDRAILAALDAMATSTGCASFRSSLALFEPFGPRVLARYRCSSPVDFRWEREWRVVGNVVFDVSDIAFGLCPAEEVDEFEALLDHRVPFVDPHAPLPAIKAKLASDSRLTALIKP